MGLCLGTVQNRGPNALKLQAVYTFPVGVTTLWWYAPADSLHANETFVVQADGAQQPWSAPDA